MLNNIYSKIVYIQLKINILKYIMNVLVYGANGWIGGQFVEILKNNQIKYV